MIPWVNGIFHMAEYWVCMHSYGECFFSTIDKFYKVFAGWTWVSSKK